MNLVNEFIESGILELYVLGQANEQESSQVEIMANAHEAVRHEIEKISITLEELAMRSAIAPDPTIKPFFMATIRYIARMEAGEVASFPQELTKSSQASDYNEWLNRPELALNEPLQDVFAHIIGHTEKLITAIVWIKDLAPEETHDDQFERFLILEGSCEIVVEDKAHRLYPGDFMEIPLHKNHHVNIISDMPCKIILQRVAA